MLWSFGYEEQNVLESMIHNDCTANVWLNTHLDISRSTYQKQQKVTSKEQ